MACDRADTGGNTSRGSSRIGCRIGSFAVFYPSLSCISLFINRKHRLENIVNKKKRLLLTIAIFCGSLAAAYFTYDAGFAGTEAGVPEYWITVDEKELDHIRSAADRAEITAMESVERRGGIAIVKADENALLALTGAMHDSFHKCAGFIRHSTYDEAVKMVEDHLTANTELQLVDYTINNQAVVAPMVAAAEEPRVRQTIMDLSALPTRRHDQQGGIDGANMILSKWRTLALGRTDISVMPYAHFNANGDFITQQPSIVMTIQGTELPSEIVVVGGHQDSINSTGATALAPGADDDASGIASMTEAIRVLIQSNFRPKRTVQFMAYAAEEIGLVGSKNIADNYRLQNKNVIGVVQLDMTNYKGPSADIAIITDNTNAAQNQFIRDLVTAYQPSLVVIDSACGYGCSDHASWHNKQYPASMPFEAKYPAEYNTALHKTTDTLDRSANNANHALKFAKLAISFVGELAKGNVPAAPQARTRFDFDGDAKADLSVFRPTGGIWHIKGSTAGYSASAFGIATDRSTPDDYDGDGKTDIAVYRDGVWHLLRSNAGYSSVLWGSAADVPQPGDFDGDGKADLAVFRPSNGTWYVLKSTGGNSIFQFGISTDKPVAGDFDGDNKTDAAVYRDGIWHVLGSTAGYSSYQFGLAGDKPIVGDFDGDGKDDSSVYRSGVWYMLRSTAGFSAVQWGIETDVPAAADFDGDGKADIGVYRSGTWYILNSLNSSVRIEQFGVVGDVPSPASFNQ